MNKKNISVTILVVIAIIIAIAFTTKKLAPNHQTSKQTKSNPEITLGSVARENKTKLFYQYVGSGESLTRDSEVQVIAIKGYKAAVYSPIKLSNIINKSDNQIIKLAKEADKDNAQKIQIASENKIKTGFLNAPDQPDSTKELVKKNANTKYADAEFNKYQVSAKDNGKDKNLIEENVTIYKTNRWVEGSNKPQMATYSIRMYGNQNYQDTIDSQKFIGIGDDGVYLTFTKTNSFKNHFILDNYNDKIIDSLNK